MSRSPRRPSESKSPWRGIRSSFDAWAEARELVDVSRAKVFGYAALGAVVGVTEAIFLALLAGAGIALATESRVRIDVPLVSVAPLSMNDALVIGTLIGLVTLAAQLELQRGLARLSTRVVSQLRRDAYQTFVATEWEVQADEGETEFLNLVVTFVPRYATVVVALVNQLNGLATMTFYVLGAVFLAPVIAAGVVVIGAVLLLVLLPLQSRTKNAGFETAQATSALVAAFGDAIGSGRDIKSYGVEQVMARRLSDDIERVERPTYRARLLQGAVPVLYQRLVLLFVLLALAIASALEVRNLAGIGAALILLLRTLQKGQQVQAAQIGIAEMLPWMGEVRSRYDRYRASQERFGPRALDAVETIEVRDVGYTYPNGKAALRGVTFSTRRGELIGLIGPSGGGKTTLSEILVRLRRPSEGRYLVNGVDANEYSRDAWADAVAMVPQFGRAITATVAENIRFLRSEVDDEHVRSAATRAHLAREIEAMDDGYATLLAERGERGLSGGQKQRLAIARALAGTPTLVVLDEPTSALDHEAEAAIMQTIDELKSQACVIVIAHRMSTLRRCDRVLVLAEGSVEAFCTIDELAEQSPFYRSAGSRNGL